jgi:AcrR family transcriptional regulator
MAATRTARTTKAERTRALVLETAMGLFEEHGYEGTTMRRVAREAGLSLGSAYYHFPSKEHLVQGFYARSHAEHLVACEPVLERETRLDARLRGVLLVKFDVEARHHRFAGALFRTAADPESPLSPFSPESAPTRDDAIALFARVLDGSRTKVRGPLAEELPYLLWLYQMGLILFWVHDRSPDQRRSRHLVEATVPIVARLIRLASHPLLKPLSRSVLKLLRTFREDPGANAVPRPS